MTAVVVVGSMVGYLFVGLCWARTQALRLQKLINIYEEHRRTSYDHRLLVCRNCPQPWFVFDDPDEGVVGLKLGLLAHALFWPVSLMLRTVLRATYYTVIFGSRVLDFSAAPITNTSAKVATLREEADQHEAIAYGENVTPEERRLLLNLAKSLREQAKAIEV